MPLPGRAGLRPRRQGRARPRHRRAARRRATCSPPSRAPARPARSSRPSRRGPAVPRPGPHRRTATASSPGSRCATGGCCAPCTTPATPARSSTAAAANRKTPDGEDAPSTTVPREQWTALIPDAHPGYITWEQFEPTSQPLAANAAAHGHDRAAGPAREGPALLQGLVICGRCGQRMTVRYHQRRGVARARLPVHRRGIQAARAALPDRPRRRRRRRRSASCCSTPSPRSPSRSPSPSKPSSKPAPTKPTRCAAATSNAPATTPSSPAAATSPSTPTTGSSPTPSKPTGTTRSAPLQDAHDDYERATAAAHAALTDAAQGPRSAHLAADFPALWSDPTTPSANANASPGCSSTTSPSPRPTRSTSTSASAAGRPPASPSRSRPDAWQARQTDPDTLALLDRLLDDHTDAEVAEASTPPATAPATAKRSPASIVLRPTPLPPAAQPPRTTPRPRDAHPRRDRRAPRRPLDHHQGLAPRRPAHLPQGQRQERTALRAAHTPATPGSSNAWAASSPTESSSNQHQEVQYETNALS